MVVLGKLHHVHDMRTLVLEDYVGRKGLDIEVPDSLDYSSRVPAGFPMFDNDKYGNCVLAAIAHIAEVFGALETSPEVSMPTTEDVDNAYSAITGFSPGPPPTNDNGTEMKAALNWWRQNQLGGHKIFAYNEISNPTNHQLVKQSIQTFGSVDTGYALPLTVQDQFHNGQPWDWAPAVPAQNGAGTWGGHAVQYIGWNEKGFLLSTWGTLVLATYAFHDNYCDELWVPLAAKWETNPPPNLAWQELTADLQEVTS